MMLSTSRMKLAAAALALAAVPAVAMMHNRLVKSAPLTGSAGAAPKAISLWFAEKPELALSTIALKGADSAVVKLGAVAVMAGEKNAVSAAVEGALKPGAYSVTYKTAGSDGHPLRGSYSFTVK